MNTDHPNHPLKLDWNDRHLRRSEQISATPGSCIECHEVVQFNLHADGCSEAGADERLALQLGMDVAELRTRVNALSELVERHVGWHHA